MAWSPRRLTVTGSWWRQLPHGGDPLHRSHPPASGRWQRGEVIAAVYMADARETAWAEWYRALAELALPPGQALPRDLWRLRVAAAGIADLSSSAKLARLELAMPRPLRASWLPFQAAGERLHGAGYGGVLYPSAARPGHLALCLFRPGATLAGARPIGRPRTYRNPPAPPTGMRT